MSIKFILPGILLMAGGSVFGQTLTCSSDDMHRHYCGADTRGGVQIVQQRSGSPCRQGYSWGYDRSGVWVDHGCRADFVVGNQRAYGYGNNNRYGYGDNNGYGYGNNNGYGYGRRDRRDRDRDDDDRYRRDRRYGYGDNSQYGYRNRTVDPYGYGYGNGNGSANTVTCSSDDMRRHYCGVGSAAGVQLLRQRSDAACRQGYSWGYDRRGIWVDHGCRADFAVR